MKVFEAINRIDSLKHNTYSHCEKVEWLNRLDGQIKLQIIDTHKGGEEVIFNGYTEKENMNTELLVPAPFDEVYIRWLEAQIDYYNGEMARYNNSMMMFQAAYDNFWRHYNRTHEPNGSTIRYF